jgi:hypothetical protein
MKGMDVGSRSRRRQLGHPMVSMNFISKFNSGGKSVSDKIPMVTDLIRVGNMIRRGSRWSQMTRW